VEWYPSIKGIIVSAGSPEGKTALSQKKCKCRRCASTKLSDWYLSILKPMYEILKQKGMKLSVREFSYTVDHQIAITDAMNKMPNDVIYCIKVTPHDFYPTFPDNSLIAEIKDRPKWIEYDTMGQYYGWGIIPCPMFRDINSRMSHALKNNVDGALLRVEWERINDWNSLMSPNRMNMYLAANAALGKPVSADDAIRKWLGEEKIIYSSDEFVLLKNYFTEIWEILLHVMYINDSVFTDSSMVQMSIERAWWTMANKHSLSEWFPARKADLELDEDKTALYIKEKEDALKKIVDWKKQIEAMDNATMISDFLKKTIFLTERYIRLNYHLGKVVLLAGFIEQMKQKGAGISPEKTAEFKSAIDELEDYVKMIKQWLEVSGYTHHIFLLFNPERSQFLLNGARERLKNV